MTELGQTPDMKGEYLRSNLAAIAKYQESKALGGSSFLQEEQG